MEVEITYRKTPRKTRYAPRYSLLPIWRIIQLDPMLWVFVWSVFSREMKGSIWNLVDSTLYQKFHIYNQGSFPVPPKPIVYCAWIDRSIVIIIMSVPEVNIPSSLWWDSVTRSYTGLQSLDGVIPYRENLYFLYFLSTSFFLFISLEGDLDMNANCYDCNDCSILSLSSTREHNKVFLMWLYYDCKSPLLGHPWKLSWMCKH